MRNFTDTIRGRTPFSGKAVNPSQKDRIEIQVSNKFEKVKIDLDGNISEITEVKISDDDIENALQAQQSYIARTNTSISNNPSLLACIERTNSVANFAICAGIAFIIGGAHLITTDHKSLGAGITFEILGVGAFIIAAALYCMEYSD